MTSSVSGATFVTGMGPHLRNRGVLEHRGGQFRFIEGYTQEAAGTMRVHIAGPSPYGTLYAMYGDVSLDGTLAIELANNYEPNVGQTFEIIAGVQGYTAALTGRFAAVSGQAIGNGKRFEVIYTPTSVTLEVVNDP